MPEPLGPASAANSPARTSRLTCSSTSSAPYANDTSVADSTTGPANPARSSELSMILIMPGRRPGPTTGGENAAMAHDHGHGGAPDTTTATSCAAPRRATSDGSGSRSRSTLTFVVVEAVTAFVAGSLALLSDAAHMLTDGVAIALALGFDRGGQPRVAARARAPSGCSGSRSWRRS